MKRCPECRRDYYDDTLLYCLDDGNPLLEGPASGPSEPGAVATGFPSAEPQTAILHSTAAPGEAPTRAQINTTDQTAILRNGAEAEPQENLGGLSERRSLSAHQAAKPRAKVGSWQWQLAVFGVGVFLLVAGFFGYRYFIQSNLKQSESPHVMPFDNESGNPDIEYLSDGMTNGTMAFRAKSHFCCKAKKHGVFARIISTDNRPMEQAGRRGLCIHSCNSR